MTTLVAVSCREKGKLVTYFGSDTQITKYDSKVESEAQKWTLAPDNSFGLALAGNSTVRSYLEMGKYIVDFNKASSPMRMHNFLVKVSSEANWVHDPGKHGAKVFPMEGLFFCPEGLYLVDPDFCLLKVEEKVPVAVGSGQDFARGAMFAKTQEEDFKECSTVLKELLLTGLQAASNFDIYTSDNYHLGSSISGIKKV